MAGIFLYFNRCIDKNRNIMSEKLTNEILLSGGGRTPVSRIKNAVHREIGPWASTVHSLLRHLEQVGYGGAPRVVGTGFDNRGRETLTHETKR